MKKAYHLATCNTCQRILKEVDADKHFELQEIKSDPITENQLDELKEMAGTYEALFNRRAQKYRSLALNNKELNEEDYKKYILEEYTFLKRPVFVYEDAIFVGNSKKTVESLKKRLGI